jgi:hypothetical protein
MVGRRWFGNDPDLQHGRIGRDAADDAARRKDSTAATLVALSILAALTALMIILAVFPVAPIEGLK